MWNVQALLQSTRPMDEKRAKRRGSTRAHASELRAIPSEQNPRPQEQKRGTKTSVLVVRDPAKLARFIPAWEELASVALEPNVFYEHWMLLPALQAFGAGKDILFVIVLIRDPEDPVAPAKLGGLFPLEFVARVNRLQ